MRTHNAESVTQTINAWRFIPFQTDLYDSRKSSQTELRLANRSF